MIEDLVEVFSFSPENFCKSITPHLERHINLFQKKHISYLQGYLKELGCKTIIVEKEYVDKDYLDDFSEYYVKCFHHYERFCKRIHFFNLSFDAQQFVTLLRNEAGTNVLSKELLNKSYLGHIVVKPLPEAFVGRTCLVTYPTGNGRFFPTLRTYDVNLFGIGLTCSSLAFQEQDTVLAACATSALWSTFHKTSEMFRTTLPSPAGITRSAANHFLLKSRPLPSQGLNVYQMCQAIRDVGLEPELRDCSKVDEFTGLVYGYLRFGIPVILIVDLIASNGRSFGRHGVAVVGYNDPKSTQIPLPSANVPLFAHRIRKLYVHDDQIGPFSRIVFDKPNRTERIQTDWVCPHSGKTLVVEPKAVIIPVYHKIRITFEDVMMLIGRIHAGFRMTPLKEIPLTWDVYLSDVREVRTSYFDSEILEPDERLRLLVKNYPRFLWRCGLHMGNMTLMEILIDATDIARSTFIFDIVFMKTPFKEIFAKVLDSAGPKILSSECLEHIKTLIRA
ncbi:MAG: hypothetical protein AB1487_09775 [Thermodesulfobacteriota bacterium]